VQETGARSLLEVGCGTAHWLAKLSAPGMSLHGLDLSAGMLREAKARRLGAALVCGRASSLPYRSASFDLILCINAIHHFDSPERFIAEARRLLRPGGALVILGSDPHQAQNIWYVYDYFEGTREVDLARFPQWGIVLGWMIDQGFNPVTWQIADIIVDHKKGRSVLDDPFLARNSTSQLALLSDDAYQAGINRIKTALHDAEAEGRDLLFPVVLPLGLIVGRVSHGEVDTGRT
jgi:SAM-dependent methyltransferase